MLEIVLGLVGISVIFAYLYAKSPESTTISGTIFRIIYLGMCFWSILVLIWGISVPTTQATNCTPDITTNTYGNYTFMECENCSKTNEEFYAYPSYTGQGKENYTYEWIPEMLTNTSSLCCKNVTTPVLLSSSSQKGDCNTTISYPSGNDDMIFGYFNIARYVPFVVFFFIIIFHFYNIILDLLKRKREEF